MQSCWREKYLLVLRVIKYADDTMIIDLLQNGMDAPLEEGPGRIRSAVTDPKQSKTKEPLIDFSEKINPSTPRQSVFG